MVDQDVVGFDEVDRFDVRRRRQRGRHVPAFFAGERHFRASFERRRFAEREQRWFDFFSDFFFFDEARFDGDRGEVDFARRSVERFFGDLERFGARPHFGVDRAFEQRFFGGARTRERERGERATRHRREVHEHHFTSFAFFVGECERRLQGFGGDFFARYFAFFAVAGDAARFKRDRLFAGRAVGSGRADDGRGFEFQFFACDFYGAGREDVGFRQFAFDF